MVHIASGARYNEKVLDAEHAPNCDGGNIVTYAATMWIAVIWLMIAKRQMEFAKVAYYLVAGSPPPPMEVKYEI